MRSFVFICFLLLGVACQPVLEERILNTYPNGEPKIVVYTPENDPNEIHKKVMFYENGNLRMVSFFKDHKKSGKWLYFYEGGSKMAETNFKNDLKNGESVRWHENGAVQSTGSHSDDQRSGTWLFYDENGILKNSIQYD